jgi:radical SAM protein with 4Fe4S-binding SPASM domain
MQPAITLEYIPQLPSGLFHKESNSFHILTHPTKPSWAVVNSFGWEILKLCNGINSIQTIISTVQSQHNISRETAEKDIIAFIASITKTGILSNENPQTLIQPAAIKSVFLHLTDTCNLSCKHCYAKNMSSGRTELTDRELVLFIEHFYEAGGKALVLSGGEPLMRKNFKKIFEINPHSHFTLLTNATLIDDECASFLSRYNVSIQASIDGSKPEVHDSIRGVGAFHASLRGIEHLKNRGLLNKINLCTTVMKQNIEDLHNIFPLAIELGIPFVRFLPLRRKGNARHNWQDIQGALTAGDYERFFRDVFDTAMKKYPELEIRCGLSGYILDPKKLTGDGHWCPIGRNIVVDTSGNVYPCSLLMEDNFNIGNVRQNSMEDIQSHPVLLELLKARIARKNRIERCKLCMWKNFCQASCMGSVYEQQNSFMSTDEFCNFRIQLYEQSVIKLALSKSAAISQTPLGDTSTECF